MLRDAGFVDIQIDVKEESAKYIAEWMPGSGAEKFVASASITARKSGMAPAVVEPRQKPKAPPSCGDGAKGG